MIRPRRSSASARSSSSRVPPRVEIEMAKPDQNPNALFLWPEGGQRRDVVEQLIERRCLVAIEVLDRFLAGRGSGVGVHPKKDRPVPSKNAEMGRDRTMASLL